MPCEISLDTAVVSSAFNDAYTELALALMSALLLPATTWLSKSKAALATAKAFTPSTWTPCASCARSICVVLLITLDCKLVILLFASSICDFSGATAELASDAS